MGTKEQLLQLTALPPVEHPLVFVDRLYAYLSTVAQEPVLLNLADEDDEEGVKSWYCSHVPREALLSLLVGEVGVNDFILSPNSVWIEEGPEKLTVRPVLAGDCAADDLPDDGARLLFEPHEAMIIASEYQSVGEKEFSLFVRMVQDSYEIGLSELTKLTGALDKLLKRWFKKFAENRYAGVRDKLTKVTIPRVVLSTSSSPQSSYVLRILARTSGEESQNVFTALSLFGESTEHLLNLFDQDPEALVGRDEEFRNAIPQLKRLVHTIQASDGGVEFYGVAGARDRKPELKIDRVISVDRAHDWAIKLHKAQNPEAEIGSTVLTGRFLAFGELPGVPFVFGPDSPDAENIEGKTPEILAEDFHGMPMGFRAKSVFRTESYPDGKIQFHLEGFKELSG